MKSIILLPPLVLRSLAKLSALLLAGSALFAGGLVHAAPFTPGNLVVERIGDGTTAPSSVAFSVALLEYSASGGSPVQSLTTEFTGSNLLTDSGSATSNGQLASNGAYLAVPGINSAVGTVGVAALNAKVTNIFDSTGSVAGRVLFPTGGPSGTPPSPFSGNNFRCVLPTGATTFYASGTASGSPNTGGAWYYDGANFTQLSTTVTNLRNIGIFGGQLYVSSASGAFLGISTVGTNLPTTSGNTTTLLISTGTGSSPYGFVFFDTDASGTVDRCYIADDRTATGGGIQRWDFNGTTWTNTYLLLLNTTSNTLVSSGTGLAGLRGLTGTFSGGTATLFATTTESGNNKLVSITDSGTTPTTFSTLASAGANYNFRGVAFAPQAPGGGPTITSSGALTSVGTTYGSASASPASFSVSGTNLTAGITITPPAGYEVSTTNNFSANVGTNASPITVGAAGTVGATTIYVRLPATATVSGSPYLGNIVLSSASATSVDVATVSSAVSPRAVTVTANSVTKALGATLTGGAGSTAFSTSPTLANGESIGSVTITFGSGASAGDAPGTYTGSVTPSLATGGTFAESNYQITYAAGDVTILHAPAFTSSDINVLSSNTGIWNPAGVTVNGTQFVNLGLQGVGRVPANSIDPVTGESIGSVSDMQISGWKKNPDGSFAGTFHFLPDRGYNSGTIYSNYAARLNDFTFTFTPYTGAAPTLLQNQIALTFGGSRRFTYDHDGDSGTPAIYSTGLLATGKTTLFGTEIPTVTANTTQSDGTFANRLTVDAEGLILDSRPSKAGSGWVSDEYGPYIYHFNASGQIDGQLQLPAALV
ncbi:MAG: esterase-like activity of phytase family protein, partial [Verrucomicrobiales bacterium]|nr:esterase-like activity of phytase family protein [Verrucomicrobiales bacterium]